MTLKSNNIHYELPALTYGFTKGLLLKSRGFRWGKQEIKGWNTRGYTLLYI